MSTTLLETFSAELNAFTGSGESNLHKLLDETHGFLADLTLIQKDLERQVSDEKKCDKKSDETDEKCDETCDEKGGENKRASESTTADLRQLSSGVESWYKGSIGALKSYNTQINKFLKNILNNPNYNINLDDAYTYPLNLDGIPRQQKSVNEAPQTSPAPPTGLGLNADEVALKEIKQENQEELTKAIILHLLKIGQRDIVKDMLADMGPESDIIIDEQLLDRFKLLDEIVVDVTVNHDLTKALDWFKDKARQPGKTLSFELVEFKFHMLQFVLLLNGNGGSGTGSSSGDKKRADLNAAVNAYLYSKQNFPKFFNDYLQEISPLMTLLLLKGSHDESALDDSQHTVDLLAVKIKFSFTKDQEKEKSSKRFKESKFVGEILQDFEAVDNNQYLFQHLANEFISFYCRDLNLSNDSSLFQSILAGFINLPSFYKYNQIQRRLSRTHSIGTEMNLHSTSTSNTNTADGTKGEDPYPGSYLISPYSYDLPFQLPDANNFLFKYHPIFICPVSKEQLIPLTVSETVSPELENRAKRPKLDNNKDSELVKTMQNPVVVLKYCQHVALKESVWQLSKKGSEVFKCHYCYKKHKLSEVSEAYFIDL